MEILLSFIGFHDPFAETPLADEPQTGPILTVLSERSFSKVCLLVTPRLVDRAEATKQAIAQRHPDIVIELLDVPLADPTNYRGILSQLRTHFRTINLGNPGARYSIAVSSGTPHMHASWILLAASGEIPAKVLQSSPPQFVSEGRSLVKEIDISQQEFPQVTRPMDDAVTSGEGDETELVLSAARELGIVGNDPAFVAALRQAFVYAQYDDTNILLLGETGSGKEYFARFIHQCSRRASRSLVTVNCGSIPENLFESHLFGHRRGAFTGASSNHDGKFKAADGGVIFLDELGELPVTAQAKLLRVLEQGEIEPVGSSRPERVNVKIIAATNRDLQSMVNDGSFREDLFQRFGSAVSLPALRQRCTDIPQLALHLLGKWNATHERQKRLSPDSLRVLADHDWPGNVREMANVIRESAMLSSATVIQPNDMRFGATGSSRGSPSSSSAEPAPDFRITEYLETEKARLIERTLEMSSGNQSAAARLLGLTPQAISQHLRRTKT